MQQTNVIHVGQGGTSYLPSSQQPVQNMQTMQQSSHRSPAGTLSVQPTATSPAAAVSATNSLWSPHQALPCAVSSLIKCKDEWGFSTQQQQPQVPLVKREAPTDHYFPQILTNHQWLTNNRHGHRLLRPRP